MKELMALPDIDKIVNYLRTLEIPATIASINSVKYIVSIESDDVIDMLQIRYNGNLQVVQKVKGGYLICRPY